MPLIAKEDLYKRVRENELNEIVRDSPTIIDDAISAAIDEVKMYLSRFDLLALFGNDQLAPTVQSNFLKNLCIDIAIWRLILLCNVGIDFTVAEKCHDLAIKTLNNIQNGKAMPADWPYKDTTGQSAPQGNSVHFTSIRKQRNNW